MFGRKNAELRLRLRENEANKTLKEENQALKARIRELLSKATSEAETAQGRAVREGRMMVKELSCRLLANEEGNPEMKYSVTFMTQDLLPVDMELYNNKGDLTKKLLECFVKFARGALDVYNVPIANSRGDEFFLTRDEMVDYIRSLGRNKQSKITKQQNKITKIEMYTNIRTAPWAANLVYPRQTSSRRSTRP